MSLPESAARAAVGLAVVLLPAKLRGRYREQWNADLRDAAGEGIPASGIAIGSLAFAATLARPLPWAGRVITPEMVYGRSRLAVALATSSAIIALCRSAFMSSGGITGNSVYDFAIFLFTGMLLVYSFFAPVVAVALVSVTRAIAPRVRVAVWLLVLASLSGVARGAIDSRVAADGSIYGTAGTTAYAVGLVVLVVAAVLLLRGRGWFSVVRRPRVQELVASGLAGLAVIGAGALGFAQAVGVWAGRTPPSFSWQSGFTVVSGSNGFVRQEIVMTQAMYEEWLALTEQFEQVVLGVFVGWVIAVGVLACVVAWTGFLQRMTPRGIAALGAGALCLLLIGHAAVMSFLWLGTGTAVSLVPTEVLLLVGSWGIVALVLAGIGGVRPTAPN